MPFNVTPSFKPLWSVKTSICHYFPLIKFSCLRKRAWIVDSVPINEDYPNKNRGYLFRYDSQGDGHYPLCWWAQMQAEKWETFKVKTWLQAPSDLRLLA